MSNLLQAADSKRYLAMTGAQTLADYQQSRDSNNAAIKAADKQSQMSGLGSAAGLGLTAGLAISGPVGWAVGGALGLASLI